MKIKNNLGDEYSVFSNKKHRIRLPKILKGKRDEARRMTQKAKKLYAELLNNFAKIDCYITNRLRYMKSQPYLIRREFQEFMVSKNEFQAKIGNFHSACAEAYSCWATVDAENGSAMSDYFDVLPKHRLLIFSHIMEMGAKHFMRCKKILEMRSTIESKNRRLERASAIFARMPKINPINELEET